MEQQETTLFGFTIDQSSRTHLAEAAKWGKFLAIVGMIICVLIAVIGIFVSVFLSSFSSQFDNGYDGTTAFGTGIKIFMIILYVGFAVLYFFPCLFLLRFANHMKNALASNDQTTLNTSFQNLKITFRYLGIVTIVIISFYLLFFFFGLAGVISGLQ